LAPPVKALVSPGECQFGDSSISVPLLERTQVSPTTCVLRFGLPDKNKPLNLSTCACILANANIDGQDVTRPYTPFSTNQQIGSFDLLVKDYGPEFGTMSYYLCSRINVGDEVAFKHIPFNVKTQAPFDYDRICMLVGGTGKKELVIYVIRYQGAFSKVVFVSHLIHRHHSVHSSTPCHFGRRVVQDTACHHALR
jgi:cytochrome-b5 reductase